MLVAAALSDVGASRQLFTDSSARGWALLVSPWVLRETRENLADKPSTATRNWLTLASQARLEPDVLTFAWPLLFSVTKDKPVLCTALACADVLLTLDRRDFGPLLGQTVYGLEVLTPGAFLRSQQKPNREEDGEGKEIGNSR